MKDVQSCRCPHLRTVGPVVAHKGAAFYNQYIYMCYIYICDIYLYTFFNCAYSMVTFFISFLTQRNIPLNILHKLCDVRGVLGVRRGFRGRTAMRLIFIVFFSVLPSLDKIFHAYKILFLWINFDRIEGVLENLNNEYIQ